MLEQEPDAYQDRAQETLEQFGRAIQDPFAERVLGLAREYNQLLAESINVSPEEKHAIISELDQEWGSIMGEEMTLTGRVTAPSLTDRGAVTQVFIDGKSVVSNGFGMINQPIVVDHEEIGTSSKVILHVYAHVRDVWSDEEIEGNVDPDATVSLAAEVDASLIELSGASIERAVSWLGLTCPELIEEVDSRLFNTKTDEEADAFLALRGLDVNEYLSESDQFTRDCFDIYLNSVINLDKKLPYGVVISGYVRRADQEDSILYKTATNQVLAYVPIVGVWPKFSDEPEDAEKWDIAARIVVMSNDKDTEDIHLVVPVDAINLMYSVRNSFYNT